MENKLEHDIELYSAENFKTLLDHEVKRSRRYRSPLMIAYLAVEADRPDAQHSAEIFAINTLNLQLRETDIPCKKGSEFIIMMPATDEKGGRVVCERLQNLFNIQHQTYDRVSFSMAVFIGMAFLPRDIILLSNKFLEQAFTAMQVARAQRTSNPIIYTELPDV